MQFKSTFLSIFLLAATQGVIAAPQNQKPVGPRGEPLPTAPSVLNWDYLAKVAAGSCPPSTTVTAVRTCIQTTLPAARTCAGSAMALQPYGCSCIGAPPVTTTVIPSCSYDCNTVPGYVVYSMTESNCPTPSAKAQGKGCNKSGH
ncbi:hypothetical protein TWF694_008052 [Orbilia ellipsospora]|uniref:Uncharacterized protein n=1 Tax=Orbilia ellipsospora TaxID=2528407 RepID=A0AAV9XHM1_9PEZI